MAKVYKYKVNFIERVSGALPDAFVIHFEILVDNEITVRRELTVPTSMAEADIVLLLADEVTAYKGEGVVSKVDPVETALTTMKTNLEGNEVTV